tara:strand:+ start:509 stop:1669 length:1161 start_codon:yes stop_codon:yes gene_type:complete
MDTMLSPDKDYPFDRIKIKTPKAVQGGTYCSNLEIDDGPIIIQTPRCKTKNGIHRTSKQIYCDLLMNQDHKPFLTWLEMLQDKVRQLILENSHSWFHDEPTMDEIEYNWNDSVRTRKDYYLIRTFIHKPKGINKIALQIYDTEENSLTIDQVDSSKKVVSILEIIGLKFSSNSFHLEICLRQLMIINEKPIFNKCLIKLNSKKQSGENIEIENNFENKKIEPEIDEVVLDKKDVQIEDNIVDTNTNNLVDKTDNLENETVNDNDGDIIEDEEDLDELKEIIPEKENNINFSINNKEIIEKPLEKTNDLEEIELNVNEDEPMTLKEPNEVYLDIYKAAREKAKKAKNEAIKAYLEAKKIKELYMLDVIDSSTDEEEEEEEDEIFSEN